MECTAGTPITWENKVWSDSVILCEFLLAAANEKEHAIPGVIIVESSGKKKKKVDPYSRCSHSLSLPFNSNCESHCELLRRTLSRDSY